MLNSYKKTILEKIAATSLLVLAIGFSQAKADPYMDRAELINQIQQTQMDLNNAQQRLDYLLSLLRHSSQLIFVNEQAYFGYGEKAKSTMYLKGYINYVYDGTVDPTALTFSVQFCKVTGEIVSAHNLKFSNLGSADKRKFSANYEFLRNIKDVGNKFDGSYIKIIDLNGAEIQRFPLYANFL